LNVKANEIPRSYEVKIISYESQNHTENIKMQAPQHKPSTIINAMLLQERAKVLKPSNYRINAVKLKKMFNSVGASSLNESDIEDLFNLFPSGITLIETPHDDYLAAMDWIGDGGYGKNIYWGREIIDNETGERFGMSVLECTEDWTNEDLGIIGLIFYNKYDERAFDAWWNLLEDDERPNGIVIYKK